MKLDTQENFHGPEETSLSERIRLLFGFSEWGKFRLIAISVFIALVLHGHVNNLILIYFVGANIVVVLLRGFLLRQFRAANPPPDEMLKWGLLFSATSFLSGLVWGFAAIFFFSEGGLGYMALLTIAVIGLSAMALAPNAAFLPAFFSFAVPAMSGITLAFLWEGGEEHYAAAGMSVVLFILLAGIARSLNQQHVKSINLRYENQVLIDRLSASHSDLEGRVSERTSELSVLNDELMEKVAQQVRTQLDLVNAKDQAEIADKAKSEFLANMSHELRTPLNAIIGFSEAIKAEVFGPLGNKKYNEYIDDVHRSGAHLLDLIADILDLSKIEAGKMEMAEATFDPQDYLEVSLRMHCEKADQKGVALKAIKAEESVFLLADIRSFRQVVANLVSNAIKFTPSGGSISVGLKREDDGRLCLYIADNGIGIEKKDIALVLERFSQARPNVDGGRTGTGLGLSIVSALMEAHQGTLELESEPGKGTTAKAYFPPERISNMP